MARRTFSEEDIHRAVRILRDVRLSLHRRRLGRSERSTVPLARKVAEIMDHATEPFLEVQIRLIEKWLSGEQPLSPGPRSRWRVCFPHWLREIEKNKGFADIARAWGVPEAEINTVRRHFDRWRAEKQSGS
jgi:hypothetical protein